MGPVSNHRHGAALVLAHLHQVRKKLSTELTTLCVLHHHFLSFAEGSELKPAEKLTFRPALADPKPVSGSLPPLSLMSTPDRTGHLNCQPGVNGLLGARTCERIDKCHRHLRG